MGTRARPREGTGQGFDASYTGACLHAQKLLGTTVVYQASTGYNCRPASIVWRSSPVTSSTTGSGAQTAMQAILAMRDLCPEVTELLPETYKPRQVLCLQDATMTCWPSRPTQSFKHLP